MIHSFHKYPTTPFSSIPNPTRNYQTISSEPFSTFNTTSYTEPPTANKEKINTSNIKKWFQQYELLQLLQSPYLSQQNKLQLVQQNDLFSTTPFVSDPWKGLDW